jgi:hypothetical protein
MARAPAVAQPEPTRSRAAQQTLTRAVLKAGDLLGVPQSELAGILGVSPATVSRMAAGRYLLQPERKEWQLATLFVRIFRSLDSITGGRDDLSRAWLHSHNRALTSIPAAMLKDVESLVRVLQYLDASRATL